MRIGRNPKKEVAEKINYKFIRIIIPVYIPNLDGFFKEALSVFKFCFDSLYESIDTKFTNITIIDNDCCTEVKEYLRRLSEQKKIDRLVVNSINYGKVQPILSEARASTEELITFSDADIYYIKGWQKDVFEIFKNFPKAGAVSSFVNPSLFKYSNHACLLDNLIPFNKIKQGKICDSKPIKLNCSLYTEELYGVKNEWVPYEVLDKQFYIQKNGVSALVGCGHATITLRRDILFTDIHKKVEYVFYDKVKIEYNNYDKYVSELGYWRLTTVKNFAYHLGNTLQDVDSNKKIYEIKSDDKNNIEIEDIRIYQNLKNKKSIYRLLPMKVKDLLLKILLRFNKIYYKY